MSTGKLKAQYNRVRTRWVHACSVYSLYVVLHTLQHLAPTCTQFPQADVPSSTALLPLTAHTQYCAAHDEHMEQHDWSAAGPGGHKLCH